MKTTIQTLQATFRNGHFYSLNNKRLVFREKAVYTLSGLPETFLDTDELNQMDDPLTAKDKKHQVIEKYGETNIRFALAAGTGFFFRFGLGKRKEGINERKYEFTGKFLEDLYFYKIKNGEVTDPESWRVANCLTAIEDSLTDIFTLTEPVFGKSPNEAFANLISTHFDRQRSTSIKIYDHFYIETQANSTIYPSYPRFELTLGMIREKEVKKLAEENPKTEEEQ